ncbi:MAG: hypothetical protein PHF35_04880 [Candidatus Moranbacteria bacterium]|nr:hypothetical protein [Candidatus Moranbacteria bacterium]
MKYPFGEKNLQALYLLWANDRFKTDFKNLCRKYNFPSDDESIDGKEMLEFLKDPKSMEFFKEVVELIYKYNLSQVFGILIAFLIDKGHLAETAKGEKVNIDLEEMTKFFLASSGIKISSESEEYFDLRINKKATSKDIQSYWSTLGKKSGRIKQSKNEERDYEVLRLRIAGKKYREIADEINNDPRFAKKKKLNYQDISVIIKRLKDKAKSISHKDS